MIGIIYIGLEITVLILLGIELQKATKSATGRIFWLACEAIGIPVFFLLGIYIASSSRDVSNTHLYFPLLLGGLPLIGLVPLALEMLKSDYFASTYLYIMLIPPGLIFFWLLLSQLGIRHHKLVIIYIFKS